MIKILFYLLIVVTIIHGEPQKAVPTQKPTTETPKAPAKKSVTETPVKKSSSEIQLENVKFAIFERDLSEPKEYMKLNFNEKLDQDFQVDSQKKVHLKFLVKDKSSSAEITLQQAFVALIHTTTKQEVIYVIETDKNSKVYSFDLDLKKHVKDFAGVSGKYSLVLIVGDTSISNSINWHLADVSVTVNKMEPVTIPKSKRISYDSLPEITHLFREQEPRPPKTLSLTFALVCGSPLLILFIMWCSIGVNFGNAKISLWALGFHISLGAIFGLYVLYWIKFNMFQTLQYLIIIGAATFVCGNRLLNSFVQPKNVQ